MLAVRVSLQTLGCEAASSSLGLTVSSMTEGDAGCQSETQQKECRSGHEHQGMMLTNTETHTGVEGRGIDGLLLSRL
jgi:hypothetical protein